MGIRAIVILLILGTAGVLGTMAYQLAKRPAPVAVAAVPPPAAKVAYLVAARPLPLDTLVLAVDQDVTQGGQSTLFANARTATTVTLEATPKEAERLAVAMHLGQLSLAIPSVEDTSPSGGGSVSGADVSTALANAGGNAGSHVQIIQGDQRPEVFFK